jgi:hypothetical protein
MKNGTILPTMNSDGRIGVTIIYSSVPTSRSRTIAKAVRYPKSFLGFVQLACLIILFRRF